MSDNVLPNLNGYALIEHDEENAARASCVLDTAAGIYDLDEDVNTSHSATFPAMFQVDPVPVGTVVEVQAKIHRDAQWIKLWASTAPSPSFIAQWSMPYNFVRAVRVSGTGAVKAFQAMFPPDHIG
jgi:hypothetical protein